MPNPLFRSNAYYKDLENLIWCHSSPGDEDEVRNYLDSKWQSLGLKIEHHGQYGISAHSLKQSSDKPILLICAHMDSPAFTVEEINESLLKLIKLGSPIMVEDRVNAILKTDSQKYPVEIIKKQFEGLKDQFFTTCTIPVDYGDRVCFEPNPNISAEKIISSPFLDNRIGCFTLCKLAQNLDKLQNHKFNIVLGATAYEEVGCYGAPVLASELKPNLAICVDATYENPAQSVELGKGPVLTLSDASVILSCCSRNYIKSLFEKNGIPLQTEVYNFSGTDARAFPLVGLRCPVLALLVATIGNHSPCESASLKDIKLLHQSIEMLISSLDPEKI